jgi:hypothetical protein
MKDIRNQARAQARDDKIIARQCAGCNAWFTTRLRSRVLCLRCEATQEIDPPVASR